MHKTAFGQGLSVDSPPLAMEKLRLFPHTCPLQVNTSWCVVVFVPPLLAIICDCALQSASSAITPLKPPVTGLFSSGSASSTPDSWRLNALPGRSLSRSSSVSSTEVSLRQPPQLLASSVPSESIITTAVAPAGALGDREIETRAKALHGTAASLWEEVRHNCRYADCCYYTFELCVCSYTTNGPESVYQMQLE